MSKLKIKDDETPYMNVEELVENIDFGSMFVEDEPTKQVGLWIKRDYAHRFLSLQKRTKCKFGLEIKRLIELCVDKAETQDPNKSGQKSA